VSGERKSVTYSNAKGRARLTLDLQAGDSVFVVISRSGADSNLVPAAAESIVGGVAGAWTIAFQPNHGAPSGLSLPQLVPLNALPDPGIRYYSGTATYTSILDAPPDWFSGDSQLHLDLGEVHDIAEVLVNGQNAGIVWWPPYSVDVTQLLKPGTNRIEVRVTNSWLNRMIGDSRPGAAPVTTSPGAMKAGPRSGALLPSGLQGPVLVRRTTVGS
jgi:hypothetical protein